MCQFSPALLGTVSRTFKLCLDLARFVELLDKAMHPLPPVEQSASAAVNKPFVALFHNEASATLSELGSAPETVSLAQFLRDRNTSNEITGLGLEGPAGCSKLNKTRPSDRPFPHFPFPRQLSGRSFASCTKQ